MGSASKILPKTSCGIHQEMPWEGFGRAKDQPRCPSRFPRSHLGPGKGLYFIYFKKLHYGLQRIGLFCCLFLHCTMLPSSF